MQHTHTLRDSSPSARSAGRLIFVLAVLGVLASCKRGAKSYPDSPEGLQALIVDLRSGDASPAQLALPDSKRWFTETFGDPAAVDRLMADAKSRPIESLPPALKKFASDGKTEISVERFTQPDDPMANGNETFAIKHAKQPLVLYSVRITPPGKKMGIHLYSFAYVDKGFRFLGKLTGLLPPSPKDDPMLSAVAELRNKDRELYFKTGKLPDDNM